ncbi:MAG: DUF4411 family protein [Nanoarchaeota archaeon]
MISNHYIIDSCSLMELNRHNPIDVFPSVWVRIESLINKGLLLAPREVLNEIMQGDDQLTKWAKKHNKMFVEPTEKQIEIVKEILKEFPALIKQNRKYDADPWVIALAVEMATSLQQTLTPIKRIVVTEEKLRGEQIKIPLVCQKYNIETIDILDMFRVEGWKF